MSFNPRPTVTLWCAAPYWSEDVSKWHSNVMNHNIEIKIRSFYKFWLKARWLTEIVRNWFVPFYERNEPVSICIRSKVISVSKNWPIIGSTWPIEGRPSSPIRDGPGMVMTYFFGKPFWISVPVSQLIQTGLFFANCTAAPFINCNFLGSFQSFFTDKKRSLKIATLYHAGTSGYGQPNDKFSEPWHVPVPRNLRFYFLRKFLKYKKSQNFSGKWNIRRSLIWLSPLYAQIKYSIMSK